MTPTYRVVSEKGPDHMKSFEVIAVVGDRRFATGSGRSKKEAEQEAARETLEQLGGSEGAETNGNGRPA